MSKKSWQSVLYIVLLLIAIIFLFRWYSTENSRRIENQNLNYAMDAAAQTAVRIESEFNNALLRIRNYAYLLSTDQGGSEINAEFLKGMESHSAFDAICFTNAQGINLSSSGKTSDSRSRLSLEEYPHRMELRASTAFSRLR